MKKFSKESEILLKLTDKIIEKDQFALSRAITMVENNPELVFEIEKILKIFF